MCHLCVEGAECWSPQISSVDATSNEDAWEKTDLENPDSSHCLLPEGMGGSGCYGEHLPALGSP